MKGQQKSHQIYTINPHHNFNMEMIEGNSNSLKVDLDCNGLVSSAPSSSSSTNKMNIKLENLTTQMSPNDGIVLHQQHHRSSVDVSDGNSDEHRIEVNICCYFINLIKNI